MSLDLGSKEQKPNTLLDKASHSVSVERFNPVKMSDFAPYTPDIVSSNQCVKAKSPESSDTLQYDNSTCVVHLADKSKNEKENENKDCDRTIDMCLMAICLMTIPLLYLCLYLVFS